MYDFEKAKVYRALYSDDRNSDIVLEVLISDLACKFILQNWQFF